VLGGGIDAGLTGCHAGIGECAASPGLAQFRWRCVGVGGVGSCTSRRSHSQTLPDASSRHSPFGGETPHRRGAARSRPGGCFWWGNSLPGVGQHAPAGVELPCPKRTRARSQPPRKARLPTPPRWGAASTLRRRRPGHLRRPHASRDGARDLDRSCRGLQDGRQ